MRILREDFREDFRESIESGPGFAIGEAGRGRESPMLVETDL